MRNQTVVSRREWLENSMFAAAASAALPASFTWANESNAPKESNAPSEILRVAVIGVNGQGGGHLSSLAKRPGCEVVAICDVDTEVGQKKGVDRIAKETGKTPKFYQDIRKLLEDKDVDAVSIAVPNHWHALAATWAMEAGKDVYVEKPVSHNVREGRILVDTARRTGRICQTGTQCRSQKGTIDAIKWIHEGKIGEVKLARGLCYKPRGSIGTRGTYQPPKTVDYDLWCGPAPKDPITRQRLHYDWHWVWPTGNGDLGNQGIHQMDIARWGLNVRDIGKGVYAFGGRVGYVDAADTPNTEVCVHDYGNKTLIFEVRGLKTADLKGAKVGVIFEGSEGYVVLTSYTSGAAFDKSGKKVMSFNGGGDHHGNWLKAVRSRKYEDLNADILEGHLSSALCHLGNISVRLGEQVEVGQIASRLEKLPASEAAKETMNRVLDHLGDNKLGKDTMISLGKNLAIDPVKEVFTGEGAAEANPHLFREYRKGFEILRG